MIASEFIW